MQAGEGTLSDVEENCLAWNSIASWIAERAALPVPTGFVQLPFCDTDVSLFTLAHIAKIFYGNYPHTRVEALKSTEYRLEVRIFPEAGNGVMQKNAIRNALMEAQKLRYPAPFE